MSSKRKHVVRPVPPRAKSADELAAEQGVKPIEDFDKFLDEVGDFWPEDETADEFITWLRKVRRGELH